MEAPNMFFFRSEEKETILYWLTFELYSEPEFYDLYTVTRKGDVQCDEMYTKTKHALYQAWD